MPMTTSWGIFLKKCLRNNFAKIQTSERKIWSLLQYFFAASAGYLHPKGKDTNKRAKKMKFTSIFFVVSAVYLHPKGKDTNKREHKKRSLSHFYIKQNKKLLKKSKKSPRKNVVKCGTRCKIYSGRVWYYFARLCYICANIPTSEQETQNLFWRLSQRALCMFTV